MPGFGILALCGYGALRRGATGGSLRWALAAQKRVPVRLILSPTRPWPLPRSVRCHATFPSFGMIIVNIETYSKGR